LSKELLTKLIGGAIVALLLAWVSFMVGQGTLDSRVTVLETNYIHIKEMMDKIYNRLESKN
jgi:hypothetical protein